MNGKGKETSHDFFLSGGKREGKKANCCSFTSLRGGKKGEEDASGSLQFWLRRGGGRESFPGASTGKSPEEKEKGRALRPTTIVLRALPKKMKVINLSFLQKERRGGGARAIPTVSLVSEGERGRHRSFPEGGWGDLAELDYRRKKKKKEETHRKRMEKSAIISLVLWRF